MKLDWQVLWEASKEPLRLLVLAIISWVIIQLTPFQETGNTYAIIILVLRYLDKILHEYGKSSENPSLTLGITRF